MIKKNDRRWGWIALGLGTLLLGYTFEICPECTERWYSRGLFPLVRYAIDYTVALSPVALIYFLLIFLVFSGFRLIGTYKFRKASWAIMIKDTFLTLGALVGGILFFFQFLWGFNYNRVPLEKQWPLEITPLTEEELRAEMAYFTQKIKELRIGRYSTFKRALPYSLVPKKLEETIRIGVKSTLQKQGYPTPGRPRGRIIKPNGTLLRFGSAGFYLPFTGECHIDGGLHHLSIPYVMSHELAHGYGIANEDACNFIAFISCINSSNLFIQYAGYLAYWRYLRSDFRKQFPADYEKLMGEMPLQIKADLEAIYQAIEKYPEWMPRVRYYTYDAYLKAQGISDGILNYNRVVLLVTAWRKEKI